MRSINDVEDELNLLPSRTVLDSRVCADFLDTWTQIVNYEKARSPSHPLYESFKKELELREIPFHSDHFHAIQYFFWHNHQKIPKRIGLLSNYHIEIFL